MLIRKTLEYSECESIRLSEEINFLELYVTLERRRFEFGFDVRFQLFITEPSRHLGIPPLLLQPIVENAIIHGLMPKKTHDGFITITLRETSTHITVSIRDNGKGYRAELAAAKQTSFGLNIVKQRLRIHNGPQFMPSDFSIEQVGDPEGTLVVLNILKRSDNF